MATKKKERRYTTSEARAFVAQGAKVLRNTAQLDTAHFPDSIGIDVWQRWRNRGIIDPAEYGGKGERNYYAREALLKLATWFYENSTPRGSVKHGVETSTLDTSPAAKTLASAFLKYFEPNTDETDE